jgi:hypothetical protein
MNKKLFSSIFILIAIILIAMGGVLLWPRASDNATMGQAVSSNDCSSDISKLMDVPTLPDFQWSIKTSTTFDRAFSIDSYRNAISPTGKTWTTSSADEGFLQKVLDGYLNYSSALRDQYGWQPEIVLRDHKIDGVQGDGPSSASEYGVVKVQNDKIRTIVLKKGKQGDLTSLSIFMSDIIPISQIIPDYKPDCIIN